MKRVLSISTLYPNAHAPRFGTFVARSLEALAARGDWEVTMINPIGIPAIAFGQYRELSAVAVDGEEGGVHVHRPRFSLIPRIGARLNPAFIARAALPLAKRLHAERPFDLVDAQFFFPDGPAAARIARALGLPLSIKARGSDITFWCRKDWALGQICEAAAEADGLLAVSKALARDMASFGLPRDKITIHHTGLDRSRFCLRDRTAARAELADTLGIALPGGAPLISTIGGLVPHKGQSLAIRALAQIPHAHLAIAGTGPEREALGALARRLKLRDRVHFLGSVDHDVMPLLLSASQAMVLPSEREGLANAWVEALACGTPVVIPDIGGAREVVTGPDAGRIAPREPEAIAAAIRELLASPPDPQAVATHAARFSWKENAAQLAEYYERLVRS
ncbi:MAG TPA: glycosyltransferase [Alteraurantiacibacter sp.]